MSDKDESYQLLRHVVILAGGLAARVLLTWVSGLLKRKQKAKATPPVNDCIDNDG